MGVLDGLLGVEIDHLLAGRSESYRKYTVRKKGRAKKVRHINAPSGQLAVAQRRLLDRLLITAEPHAAATAYYPGRSSIANAQAHQSCSYLLKLDLCDFFPSIRAELVEKAFSAHFPFLSRDAISEAVALTTIDGYLPQGAPTSPHISNLVMLEIDQKVARAAVLLGAVYTRYADDISISSESFGALDHLEDFVSMLVTSEGFKINLKKRRLLGPTDEKIVTGLNVTGLQIRPTRRFRKRTAAMVRAKIKYPWKKVQLTGRINGLLGYWGNVCGNDPAFIGLKAALIEENELI